LRDAGRRCPSETALGEHLQPRLDAVRIVQAADRNEGQSGRAVQIAGKNPRAAIRTEIAVQPLPDSAMWWNGFGLPLCKVKSSIGTPKKVAIAPPDDFWQSLQ
jgi:hypothetical protein